jgi:glycosyltransferase involved in cell wall biosynthesis
MRIAMIAPLIESVPPERYGGTERVVSVLTEEMVRRGHDVTLFASGGSRTSACLVPCSDGPLRACPPDTDTVAHALIEMNEVYRRAGQFDLIHNHNDYLAFSFARTSATPTVTTAHGRLDLPEVRRTYGYFAEQRLIAISHDQRTWLPDARWVGTVHNPIDLDHYHLHPNPGDYLVFLGRICPEKRPDRAIEIARDTGMRLVIAAKVDRVDRNYYEYAIKPEIERNRGLVEFIGEVDEHEKDDLLGGAWAYLFPVDWPEPFGLTMAEAMATGTPVIATGLGSVPEVVAHAKTGFVCDTLAGMIEAVGRIGEIDRRACRQHVVELCSPAMIAAAYERVYRAVTGIEAVSAVHRPAPMVVPDLPLAIPAGRLGA